MANVDLSLDTTELPIIRALDIYYTWIRNLFSIDGANEKLALASTVTAFDVFKDTPMFNEYSFRLWADRAVLQSPTTMDLPDFQSRYSFNYQLIVEAIAFSLESKLTPADKAEIQTHRAQARELRTELGKIQREIDGDWAQRARDLGLQAGSPQYVIEQVAFYNIRQTAQTYTDLSQEISEHMRAINRLKYNAFAGPDERQILRFYQSLIEDQYQMIRPRHSQTEKTYKLDPVELGNASKYKYNSAFEVGAEVYPSVQPEWILNNKGVRRCEIYTGQDTKYDHKSDWHGSAGGSYLFFSGSVDVSEANRRKTSANKTRKVTLSFENIVEFLPSRGPWWSLGFYDNKLIQEELENQPRTTVSLQYVIKSLVVGRGLGVTLDFSDVTESETWEEYRRGGSLGLWGFKFGGGGGGSTYTYSRSENKLSVTFQDSLDACRVLGFRVQKLDVGPLPVWRALSELSEEERVEKGLGRPD